MNWEAWLKTAAKRPSDHEDSKRQRTENEIKAALADYEPLQGRPYRVYAKGSYANNTNVRLNYDVDIAVEYHGHFYSEMALDLKGQDKSVVGVVPTKDTYKRDEFKADIAAALTKAYGKSSLEVGRIAYRIREKKTTLPADVVPCWEYRLYDRIVNGKPVFHRGSRVYPSDGGHKDNFPARQLSKGIEKNNATGRRYKRIVRALKKLQTRLVEAEELDKELPSYLTECLVYNVPNDRFSQPTYLDDMQSVLAVISNATLLNGDWLEWEEVHGLSYLFRGNRSWTREQVNAMASAAWDHMGLG